MCVNLVWGEAARSRCRGSVGLLGGVHALSVACPSTAGTHADTTELTDEERKANDDARYDRDKDKGRIREI